MLNFFKGIYKSINAFVAIAYLVLGIFVLLPTTKLTIPKTYQTALGCIMIAYSAYRFYRFYKNFIKSQNAL